MDAISDEVDISAYHLPLKEDLFVWAITINNVEGMVKVFK